MKFGFKRGEISMYLRVKIGHVVPRPKNLRALLIVAIVSFFLYFYIDHVSSTLPRSAARYFASKKEQCKCSESGEFYFQGYQKNSSLISSRCYNIPKRPRIIRERNPTYFKVKTIHTEEQNSDL